MSPRTDKREPPLPRRRGIVLPLVGVAAAIAVGPNVAVAVALIALSARLAIIVARRRRARRQLSAERRAGADPRSILLGSEPSGARVLLGERELSAHGLIVGATGAGKSTTLLAILEEQILRGAPAVVIDMKGSPTFARALARVAHSAGRRLRVWTFEGPELWNPLAAGNATECKDKLIASEQFTEPHYRRAAERYVQLALQAMLEARPSERPAIADVVEMMDPRRLGALARKLPGERAEHLRGYLATLTPDQISAIRGFGSRLAILSESVAGPFLRDPRGTGIELGRSLAGGEVALFSLNSSSYRELAAQLGTLVVQDLVSVAGRRLHAGAGGQAIVAIDEFSALDSANVIALLARGRESGVSVLLATQELADLERAGRGVRDQVLGNTGVKIAHRQHVPASAQAIAQMAGTERHWERSVTLGQGQWGLGQHDRATLRQVDRFVVEPGEVSTLAPGEAVLITNLPNARTRTVRVLPPASRDGPER